MDLSIIIVSYNVSDYLRNCLLSVRKASEGFSSEIFVVDNNSDDNSCQIVRNEFPEVNLICNTENAGYAAANNQALRLASGRYLLLLNPDTVVLNDTLKRCIEFMDSHPGAGAAGVKMFDGNGNFLPESKRSFPSAIPAFMKVFGFSALIPSSKSFNNYYLPSVGEDETAQTEVISGAFMFIRNETILKTGFLDEDYFMYGEDIDMSYRIIKSGYQNYYFPETSITHFKGASTPRDKFDDIFNFYRAMRIYVRKRSAEGEFRGCVFFLIAGIYIRELLAVIIRQIRIILQH